MKRFISACLIALTGYVLYGASVAFFLAGRVASRLVGQDLALRLQTTAVNWYSRRLVARIRSRVGL